MRIGHIGPRQLFNPEASEVSIRVWPVVSNLRTGVTISKAIAVEYSLTQLGRTIIAPLRGMCRWAKRNRRDVSADVHLPQEYEMQ